jgi:hypothetical protein
MRDASGAGIYERVWSCEERIARLKALEVSGEPGCDPTERVRPGIRCGLSHERFGMDCKKDREAVIERGELGHGRGCRLPGTPPADRFGFSFFLILSSSISFVGERDGERMT